MNYVLLVECYALLASGSEHEILGERTTLRYVQCGNRNHLLTLLGGLAPLANNVHSEGSLYGTHVIDILVVLLFVQLVGNTKYT